MAELLKGKPIADRIKEGLKKEIAGFKSKLKLVNIHIGNNSSSTVYVSNQIKTCDEVGVLHDNVLLPEDTKECDVCRTIKEMNNDKKVTGIMVQFPIPKHLSRNSIIECIDPKKDAEGIHPMNLGKIILNDFTVTPCTAKAVMELLAATGVNLYGKEVLCVGHSAIVGKPLSLMLLTKFATLTVAHIATSERGLLSEKVKNAEILIVAVGKPKVVKGEWIKDKSIVIDVGINKLGDSIVGDVEFEPALKKASYITPVPGGVGPLTNAMLIENLVNLYKIQNMRSTCQK